MPSAPAYAPLITLEQVSIRYPVGRNRTLTAVDAVDLEVRAGETLGLIGESGSGKSTVARAMVGLAPVTDGRVLWRGADVSGLGRVERQGFVEGVQMIFQDPHSALDPRRTILQSVREPMDVLRKHARRDREEIAATALQDVGLSIQMLSRYPHQLSGGQKQRANIARALVTDPKVLLCDESVAALDVALQAEILNLVQGLKVERDLTVVFISHDLSVVKHIADRIAVMYLGRIVEKATTGRLVTSTSHPYTEALLSAQPVVRAEERRERIILAGDIPSPLAPPPGCRFSSRCPAVVEACRRSDPPLVEVGPEHRSACLRIVELYGEAERMRAS